MEPNATDTPAEPTAESTPAPEAGPETLLDTAGQPAAEAAPETPPAAEPAPEGFLGGKYKTPADLEVGYKELQRQFTEVTAKLKGFPGAPETYELSMPEDLQGAVEWNAEDPMLSEFQAFAKESGMSQESFTKALHMLAKYEYAQEAVDLAAEKAALGERADERLSGFAEWGRANLSEEQFQAVMAPLGKRSSPSAVFKALETVLAATRQPSIARPADDVRSGMTLEDVNQMYAKTNEKGQRLVDIDPAYLKQCREARRAVVGDADHTVVVGRRGA